MIVKCSYQVMVPLADLKPHPKNRNDHSEEQIKRLAEIFEYQGIRHPIVVSSLSGNIVAGHGRYAAAQKLKYTEFPVDVQHFETAEQEYAFMVSDNAVALWAELDFSGINNDLGDLGPDFNIDMLGIENFEIDVADKDGLTDPDEVPEPPKEPKTKRGDIYKLGNHRLMCGDSAAVTDIDALMGGDSPDAVVTDPPYGIGIDGQKKSVSANPKHNRKAHEFRGWDTERPDDGIFNYILGLSVPAVIWGGNYFADLLPPTRGWIYWSKGQDGLTMSDGELAWTTEGTPLRSCTVNRAAPQGSVHPTQKPLQVVEFSLDYINAGESVLDLFGGSGSTLIACEKTKRKCFMMEIDPRYVDVIVSRWENFTGQKAELINAGNN